MYILFGELSTFDERRRAEGQSTKKKKAIFDADDNMQLTHRYLFQTLIAEFGVLLDAAGKPSTLTEDEILHIHHGRLANYWQGQSNYAAVKARAKYYMNDNDFQTRIPFFEGAAETVAATALRFSPVCATARAEELRAGTLAAFAQNGLAFDELVMRDPAWPFDQGSQWKAKWILDQGDDIAFVMDDSHSLVQSLLSGGFKGVIILFQPRIKIPAHPQVRVVYTWSEAGRVIESL